ncbi:MAG: Rpn family recombination-promoting nuclease/putative transposase [Deltaproteobacteria bacterium]|nr:Rpn family recombination-promoting nuclease/putative transposase [Deltaproteobacteria bacterium]MBF0525859.1 Rpn family recombination-promoting nuclease/putative transposase [Deltaproteobacteria bacterium]
MFSGKEEARDFLLNHLPESVVGLLDLDSLEPGKDTFVDQELRESLSDLIYQVYTKADSQAYVYVLFEHKSHPEPLIALHFLRYMVRIWEHQVKQGVGRYLPPIIPLVVYHGWKHGRPMIGSAIYLIQIRNWDLSFRNSGSCFLIYPGLKMRR